VSRLAEMLTPACLGRGFRWPLTSSWITDLGDGMTLAAGPLLVASQTLNQLAIAIGGVAAAAALADVRALRRRVADR